jgi:hypothetical protein
VTFSTASLEPGQLSPVDAFWSVTMYDGKTQLFVAYPTNRYLVNSPMLPDLKSADGSLTLYIKKDSPGVEKQPTWRPAPNDTGFGARSLYPGEAETLRQLARLLFVFVGGGSGEGCS